MDHTLLAMLVIGPAMVVGQVYALGRRMSKPEKLLRPIAGGLTPYQQQTLLKYKEWLASVHLQYRTSFQFDRLQVAVFQQGNEPRFFSFVFHQKLAFCAESYLEDLTILDSDTSGSMGLFPRPGAYVQSFPNMRPEEVWQRHLEGEAHLTKKFGFAWVPLKRPYEAIMLDGMRLRMKHNLSQPFWPLRVLYRFAVTRHRIANRSIVQQFP